GGAAQAQRILIEVPPSLACPQRQLRGDLLGAMPCQEARPHLCLQVQLLPCGEPLGPGHHQRDLPPRRRLGVARSQLRQRAALGPGSTSILSPAADAAATRACPGSDTPGIPASEMRATSRPAASARSSSSPRSRSFPSKKLTSSSPCRGHSPWCESRCCAAL